MSTDVKEIPLIYKAMSGILSDVEAIKKDKVNEMQRFKFRGIDDMYNELHGLFAKHNVFLTSEILEVSREERQTKSGGNLIFTLAHIRFTFFTLDGSSVSSVLLGEAQDSGDKSANKAMSIALKYALMQTFLIPTEDLTDPDATTPPPSTPKQSPLSPSAKLMPLKKIAMNEITMGKLVDRIKTGNESKGDLINHAKEAFILTSDQLKILENL